MAQNAYTFCLPRRGWVLALIGVSLIFTFGVVFIHKTSARKFRETTLEQTIAVLDTRLRYLETQYGGKQEDFNKIQETLLQAGFKKDQSHKMAENEVQSTTHFPSLEALLKNINGSRAAGAVTTLEKPEIIKTPFALRIIPHLLDDPDSLRPAYIMRTNQRFVDYVFGIPHVKRDKETYLFQTLNYLLNRMTTADKNSTLVIVMIGETDLEYVVKTAHEIEKAFPTDVERGLIEVISPRESYYPDFGKIALTLGDSPKRVKWRTKQNLDTLFVMAYAQPRCLYYMMLEDDVIAAENYMKEIMEYIAKTTVAHPNWFYIQFSTTGGIGKLFRSSDLIHFITYVQLFYSNMPIDWLTESYLADRVCGINKQAKECTSDKNGIRPTYKKNLFKHIGQYSSLKGKYQKVKDPSISPAPKFYPHKNPPVTVINCDLEHHEGYTIEAAYAGETFFWGKPPKQGDSIEFWFENPTIIDRFLIRSGNVDSSKDIIYMDPLEILTTKPNDVFTQVGAFDEFGLVEGNLSNSGALKAIRIHFNETKKTWVMITEIEFVALNEDKVT